jgi:Fe-S cluster assembly iron-binding protein IscA
MFEVTLKAKEMIRKILKHRGKDSPIRIMLSPGGCPGTSLAMFLDKPKPNDKVFNQGDLIFLIDKDLYERAQTLKIDYGSNPMGPALHVLSKFDQSDKCGDCACEC